MAFSRWVGAQWEREASLKRSAYKALKSFKKSTRFEQQMGLSIFVSSVQTFAQQWDSNRLVLCLHIVTMFMTSVSVKTTGY